ncbi:probable Signal peptidase complex catalytic subunit SEC11 [Saccharomycodes ludwigii]|uniref:Signal peptidase complex catalytic subunit SEC11 n=1 Tax=Saccharomycodes ludwigii TaxID=36035 RepID=A0A376BB49_9ASCO|nr:hypothetical protein SCDLUD_003088 [Saccharomycodes ludwigii]KAH3900120.1 hypothetical protein SCDLUD_003088 [Saccharomycodes ludwigii]SSD61908.1 probable Signal peptidase complex catalytic subunit SEC11 [Saccharomycodes ludwigii]
MNLRKELTNFLNLCFIFSGAFMFWKGLSIITNSESPIVVVLSGSMEPAFHRGDVLFLWNKNKYNNIGDIVVYEVEHRQIPIVHRVLREHKNRKGEQFLLTKGDNNNGNDIPLYAPGKKYLQKSTDILGTVKGFLPQVGYVTIWVSENKNNAYLFYGLMAIAALFFNN